MTLELHGSPRTAARQLIELLTRDNILNEDGSLNQRTVQSACRYAGGEQCIGQRTLDEWAAPPGQLYVDGKPVSPPKSPRSPEATDGSNSTGKSETPESICEQCTQEETSPPADTSHTQSSSEPANSKGTHSPFFCQQN